MQRLQKVRMVQLELKLVGVMCSASCILEAPLTKPDSISSSGRMSEADTRCATRDKRKLQTNPELTLLTVAKILV